MSPLLSIEYRDPVEPVVGFLVVDTLENGLAAGGLRVRPGLTVDEVKELAWTMTKKQKAVGLGVGGAKAGIDMDPSAPYKRDVLTRFLEAMRPLVMECWSVGPDMNTSMAELEAIAKTLDVPSLKIAVARRRGVPEATFLERYALLEEDIAGMTVNQLRGGSAAAGSVLALRTLGMLPERPRIAIQGAGTVGGAAARLLVDRGCDVVAWADDQKMYAHQDGVDVVDLLARREAGRLPDGVSSAERGPSEAVIFADCDVLILAAVSRAFGADKLSEIRARTIVEAANVALEEPVEAAAAEQGMIVIPDVIASAGGSLAIEAIYEHAPETGGEILEHVYARVADVLKGHLSEPRGAQGWHLPRSY